MNETECVFSSCMTTMKTVLALLMLLTFMLILPESSGAGIYKYTDSNGNVIFTDEPPAGVKSKKIKIRDDRSNIYIPAGGDESNPQAGDGTVKKKRPYSDIKVVLYMKKGCQYSRKAGNFIRSLGVKILQFDVNQNPGKKREMINKGYGSRVPLIDVEGIIIPGYNPDAIKAAIEKQRIL